MSDLKLGHLIEGNPNRDAIHMAVAPVIAWEALVPGQHVGFIEDGKVGIAKVLIGVVDPFLKAPVKPGERIWLFMYPNTITGLRHEWTHPAFGESKSKAAGEDSKEASFKWLSEFCAEHNVPFDDLISGVQEFLESNEKWPPRYVQEGSTSLRDGNAASPEFWAHFTAYTGVIVPPDKITENPFCCSC